MPKILIVEDQVLTANHIKNILNDNNWHQIEIAYKINHAIELLKSFAPDIILLDINVDGKNSGIEWAKKNVKDAKIIYITGQTELETMQLALSTNPISYLTKPVKKVDLVAAIQLLAVKLQTNSIIIKNGFELVKLKFDNILYIKSDNNYIDIQTTTSKYSIRNSLDKFLEELNHSDFVRIHRSFIVNKSKVSKKLTTSLFIDDYEIPISRSYEFNF